MARGNAETDVIDTDLAGPRNYCGCKLSSDLLPPICGSDPNLEQMSEGMLMRIAPRPSQADRGVLPEGYERALVLIPHTISKPRLPLAVASCRLEVVAATEGIR